MNKVLEIGYPMEYEDDKHIIRTSLWLKEYEVELLEEKLKEYNHIKKQKDNVVEYMKNYIGLEDAPINERIKIEFKELLRMLGVK